MRAYVLCLVLLVIAGCSSVITYDKKPGGLLNQQNSEIQQWRMQGRLLIKSDEVMTANVQWRHDGKKDMLKLSGILGLGATLIELNEDEIILHNAQGERQASQDIDAFIARQIGFVVPITALRMWVLGVYLQEVPVQLFENGFLQLGWRVVVKEYMDTPFGVLPRKIKVTKDNMTLKLIIDQWEIK